LLPDQVNRGTGFGMSGIGVSRPYQVARYTKRGCAGSFVCQQRHCEGRLVRGIRIERMVEFDLKLIDKRSYGLRAVLRIMPNYSGRNHRKNNCDHLAIFTERLINEHYQNRTARLLRGAVVRRPISDAAQSYSNDADATASKAGPSHAIFSGTKPNTCLVIGLVESAAARFSPPKAGHGTVRKQWRHRFELLFFLLR